MIIGLAGFVFINKPGVQTGTSKVEAASLGKFQAADLGQAFIEPTVAPDYMPIRDYGVAEPEFSAEAVILVDNRTGRTLFEKNADEKLPIASLTKLMSAIVASENMNLDRYFSVPAAASNVDGNGADLVAGEELSGHDLMRYMLIPSSNDAAETFAQTASREGINFVDAMNKKALELGMTSTHFSNASGLDNLDAYSTAGDVARLALYASQFSEIGTVSRTEQTTIFSLDGQRSHQLINTDILLSKMPNIILGKTGNTTLAQGAMVTVNRVSDRDSFTAVVLKTKDRFGEMEKLVKFAKAAHSWK